MKSLLTKLSISTLITLLAVMGGTSCRSKAIPCPSLSHVTKAEGYQLGNGPAIKYDRNGRVKK